MRKVCHKIAYVLTKPCIKILQNGAEIFGKYARSCESNIARCLQKSRMIMTGISADLLGKAQINKRGIWNKNVAVDDKFVWTVRPLCVAFGRQRPHKHGPLPSAKRALKSAPTAQDFVIAASNLHPKMAFPLFSKTTHFRNFWRENNQREYAVCVHVFP